MDNLGMTLSKRLATIEGVCPPRLYHICKMKVGFMETQDQDNLSRLWAHTSKEDSAGVVFCVFEGEGYAESGRPSRTLRRKHKEDFASITSSLTLVTSTVSQFFYRPIPTQ